MQEPVRNAAKPVAKKNEWLDTAVVIIEALVIALVIRTFLYQPFSIPTGSMQSTLMIGDYVLASKYSWGFGTYSFPFPLPFNGRIFGREPNRGDIAVFQPTPQSEPYIKRVIGLPGDQIQVTDGLLYINGKPVERELVGTAVDRNSQGQETPVMVYTETLPNGVKHTIQERSDHDQLDNTGVFNVPAGHYFMMGDNRDNSSDSRDTHGIVGYVAAGSLIGKAEVRFFSIKDNLAPWQFWLWPGNVRLDRMFQSIY